MITTCLMKFKQGLWNSLMNQIATGNLVVDSKIPDSKRVRFDNAGIEGNVISADGIQQNIYLGSISVEKASAAATVDQNNRTTEELTLGAIVKKVETVPHLGHQRTSSKSNLDVKCKF